MTETFSTFVYSMPSLKVIAILKVAILECCDRKLKRKILYTPCSLTNKYYGVEPEKDKWNKIIKNEVKSIIKKYQLPEILHEKFNSAVFVIGFSMVNWAEYHEGILGFSREISMNLLNDSLFTLQGKIDNKKAAEELMKAKCLSIQQKYCIACLYCFVDDIPVLFSQMSEDDVENNTSTEQPGLVRYWSYYLTGKLDQITGELTLAQCLFQKSLEDGSKTAVAYWYEQASLNSKEFDLVSAALKVLRSIVEIFWAPVGSCEFLWVPIDYHMDAFFFLLTKMREYEQLKVLQKDIGFYFGKPKLFNYFLNWPYQDNFMKAANLMWDFLPEITYGVLLAKICDFIDPVFKCVKFGEEKIYNYKVLFKEFWLQSPERFKRYIFNNNDEINGIFLIERFLGFAKFTSEDAKVLELVLSSATDKDKEFILSSFIRRDIWIDLLRNEKWKPLDVLTTNLFAKSEEADKFRRELIFTEKAQRVCIDFVKRDKWNSFFSALKWSVLTDEGKDKLKKALMDSPKKIKIYVNLIARDQFETFYKFVNWCFTSEEESEVFRKEIVYSETAMEKCAELATNESSVVVDKFINYCFSSAEEIKRFKRDVAYKIGGDFCEKLISYTLQENVYKRQPIKKSVGCTYNFRGGKWVEVEKFLTWCFSSEKEINEFKRKEIKVRRSIHHDLILACQWEEADIYFAWLGLSAEEKKDLKKDDLFNTYMTSNAFRDMFYQNEAEFNYFYDFGNHQEAIELILRWYLNDKETVLQFSSEFKLKYLENVDKDEARVKDAFKKFDLVIAQRLCDLEEEKKGFKRKSEDSPSSKKFCN